MPANETTIEGLLRAHAPHAPESLRERVLALEPKPARSGLPSRRLVLVALPVAVGVAVSVAVVHGIAGSGSSTPTTVALQHLPAVPPERKLVAGVGNDHAFAPVQSSAGQRASATPATPITPSTRLQHVVASMQVRVTSSSVSQATTRATHIATSLGGYAKSVDYSSSGTSVLDLRVPTQNVKIALARLAGLGALVSQQLSISDLQQQLLTQSAEITQLRARIAALQAAVKDPSLPDAQRVLLRIKLAESRRALSQRLHAQKGTIASGTTSSISLVIGTKRSIVPAAHHRGRLGRIVHSAVGFLALEAVIALFALIVISPLALAAALVWLWRRRAVDRLLAS